MPEPVTVTVLAVTAVIMSVIGYKTIDKIVSTPAEIIKTTGKSVEELIKSFSAELRNLFGAQPRVSVDKIVIQKAPSAISELCLAKTEIEVTAEIQEKWMMSSKRLAAKQTFVVKAGYDLNRLKFDFDARKNRMRVTISEATIVNVVAVSNFELEENEGWWNRVNKKDREGVVNALPAKAKEEAMHLGVHTMAEAQLKVVLERILGASVDVNRIDDAIAFENDRMLPDIPAEAKRRLGLVEERRIPAQVPRET